MICLDRDQLVKNKGNVKIEYDIEWNLNNFEISKIIDILVDIIIKESKQCDV